MEDITVLTADSIVDVRLSEGADQLASVDPPMAAAKTTKGQPKPPR